MDRRPRALAALAAASPSDPAAAAEAAVVGRDQLVELLVAAARHPARRVAI